MLKFQYLIAESIRAVCARLWERRGCRMVCGCMGNEQTKLCNFHAGVLLGIMYFVSSHQREIIKVVIGRSMRY